jgi:isopenicillin-N epimerase
MAGNRRLAAEAAEEVAGALNAKIAGPASMRGSMAALLLRVNYDSLEGAAAYRRALSAEHRVMAPIHVFAGMLWLRISAQIYNSAEDYRRLISACREILA